MFTDCLRSVSTITKPICDDRSLLLAKEASVNTSKLRESRSSGTIRGLALGHYYTNLKSNPLSVSFNKLCEATRNYFKGLEYKRDILTQ
jgi:hypothetical protein